MIPVWLIGAALKARSACGVVLPFLGAGLRALGTFVASPSNLVIGGLIFGTTFIWAHHNGREKERGIQEVKIENERRSQSIITNAAEAKAAKDLKDLSDERDLVSSQLDTVLAEASADANAKRVCLGLESIKRINRGRAKP